MRNTIHNMTKKLSITLDNIQSNTIGLFKYPLDNTYRPVIGKSDNMICVISIGNLLGMNTSTYTITSGIYIEFPDGKSLRQMMDSPIEFNEWYKTNCK